MKHESIVVVYDSCQAIAEEIADKLGAETVSVQSMNIRQIENSQSLVLAVEFQADGPLSPHWQLEKPRVFDPRGQAALTPMGKI